MDESAMDYTILEKVPTGIALLDPTNWSTKYCNERMLRMLYVESQSSEPSIFENVPPLDISGIITSLRAAMSGKDQSFRVFLRNAQGLFQRVSWTVAPYTIGERNLCCISAIPDWKLGEIMEDRQSFEWMCTALESLPIGAGLFEVGKNTRPIYVNGHIPQLVGMSMKEYQSHTQDDLLGSLILEHDRPHVARCLRSASKQSQTVHVSCHIKRKDDLPVLCQIDGFCINADSENALFCLYLRLVDEQQTLYRELVNRSITYVLVVERSTRMVLFANSAWKHLEGIAPEENVIGRNLFDIISPTRRIFDERSVEDLPEDHFNEIMIEHPSGAFLHAYCRKIDWNGIPSYVVYLSDETKEHAARLELETLIENVPGGCGIFSFEAGVISQQFINQGYRKILGHDIASDNTVGFAESIGALNAEDKVGLMNMANELVAGSGERQAIFRVANDKGRDDWVRVLGRMVKTPQGKHLLYCSFYNANAEKEAELRYERQIADSDKFSADTMVVKARFNLNADAIEYGQHTQASSYSEFLDSLLQSVTSDEYRMLLAQQLDRKALIAAGDEEGLLKTVEYPIHNGYGSVQWIELNYRTFKEPHSGDLMCFINSVDVTLKKLQQEVNERLIVENYEAIAVFDVATCNYLIHNNGNNAYIRANLKDPGKVDALHKYIKEHVVAEDMEEFSIFSNVRLLLQDLEEKGKHTFTFMFHEEGKQNRRKQLWITHIPAFNRLLLTCSDVMDIYSKEEAELLALKESARIKSEFLARVSHDMRTPMNVIIGLVAMARDQLNDPAELESLLVQIGSVSDFLLRLINDLLDVERIESMKMVLHPQPYTYEKFYNSIKSIILPLCNKKGIEFNMPFYTGFPALYVDPMRFEQVFINLLSNAVKFTAEGGKVEMLVDVLGSDSSHVDFRMLVKDNGIGMSNEFLQHMYEPFTQESSIITTNLEGTGLGLTIVRSLVELMGGHIDVHSEKHQGTTFTISMSLPYVQDGSYQPDSNKEGEDWAVLKGLRILLAEDHPINARIAQHILGKVGATSVLATNGEMVVGIFETSTAGYFDAILMDIRMPGLNGLDATREIRKLDRPDAKTIPIIAMTANISESDYRESQAAGMDAHLEKPIKPQQLYQTLSNLTKKHPL